MKNIFYLFSISLLCFTSCTKSDNDNTNQINTKFSISYNFKLIGENNFIKEFNRTDVHPLNPNFQEVNSYGLIDVFRFQDNLKIENDIRFSYYQLQQYKNNENYILIRNSEDYNELSLKGSFFSLNVDPATNSFLTSELDVENYFNESVQVSNIQFYTNDQIKYSSHTIHFNNVHMRYYVVNDNWVTETEEIVLVNGTIKIEIIK